MTTRVKGIEYKGMINVTLITTIDRIRSQKKLFEIEKEYWSESKQRVLPRHRDNVKLNNFIEESIYQSKTEPLIVSKSYTLHNALLDYSKNLKSLKKEGESLKYIRLIQDFKDINCKDLTTFYFEEAYKKMCLTIKEGTASKKISKVVTSLKFAKKNEYEVKDSIFYMNFKSHKSYKEKLTKEEFERILSLDVNDKNIMLAKDIYCFQIFARGLRIGDALTAKHEQGNDYLIMTDNKTQKRNSQKIIAQMMFIIDKYKGSLYIFPCIKTEFENTYFWKKANIEGWTTIINKNLKIIALLCGIKKKLTTHTARHTFASFANNSGISLTNIQKMLNHSSASQTERYLDELKKYDELDNEMMKIF